MSLIGKNIFWLLVSQLATWTATLISLVIVPNSLGSTDFGTYGYAVGYVQFFTLIAGLGTSTYLSRAVARDESIVGPYVWNAVLLKLVLTGVLTLAALGIAVALGNRGTTLALIAIGCGGMLFFLLNEVFSGTLIGMQRMARPAMWTVAQVYFQTVFGVIVLLLGLGVIAYATVMALGTVIPAVATALMVRPMMRGHRHLDFGIWRLLVLGGIPLVMLSFFNLIYGTVNVPILHTIAGDDPVGWYVLALRWAGIPVFISTTVIMAFFPAFARHGNPMTAEFAPLVNKAIHMVLYVTVPASIGIALVADDLIRLIYQDGFDSSIVLIQILAIQIPIATMDSVLASALVAADRLNRYLYVSAVAAALNPIACVIAINITQERYGNGAIGAAAVMVATETWVMIGALILKAPGVMNRETNLRIARVGVAGAAMALAVLLASSLPLPAQITIGVATYGLASLAFGAISVVELRQAGRQMGESMRRS